MQRIGFLSVLVILLLGAGLYVVGHRNQDQSTAYEEPPGRRPDETGWLRRTFPYFEADLDAYISHEKHQAVVALLRDVCTWVLCDYVI